MNNSKSNTPRYCLNCETLLSSSDNYCKGCGQNKKAYRHNVLDLARDFFGTIFNLDAKIWVTARDLWIPAKLTKAYIAGRKKRYINPIRLFVVLLFIVLAIVTNEFNRGTGDYFGEFDVNLTARQYEMMIDFDTLSTQYPLSPAAHVDSIRTKLFKSVLNDDDQSYDLRDFGILENKDIQLRADDIASMSKEEIFEKYKVTTYLDQIVVSKAISTLKDPRASIRVLIGNVLWIIVLTIILISLVMKLLYIRGKHFLVEHVILLVHHHCFLFALICMEYLIYNLMGYQVVGLYFPVAFTLTFFYILIDLKMYFRQSWFRTLVKFFLISFCYLIILIASILVILVVSFLVV